MAEKKINGKTYKVEPALATTALDLQLRLLKVIGAGIEKLPEILQGAGSSASPEQKEAANGAAIAAFTEIFMKGDIKEMTSLVTDIVNLAMVQRPSGAYETVDIDGDFTGDLKSMFALVVFVLQEQFGDFFQGVLANGNLKSNQTD